MYSLPAWFSLIVAFLRRNSDFLLIVFVFSSFYVFLAWIVNGGGNWWVIDYVSGKNIFYGDDAYRFFLARSAWSDPALYAYNFDLPLNLLLENLLVNVAGENLLFARYLHALLGSCALGLIWQSGLILGINRVVMSGAVLVMGLMPLYALVSISFYGEAWLGLGLCLLLLLFLQGRMLLVSFLTGLLPLIRPEGIFFLVPIWVFMLKERRWRESFLVVFPGFLYFLFLLAWLPEFSDFMHWRIEIRRVLSKFMYRNDLALLLSTYSLFLTVPAILGLLFKPLHRLWPFMAGAMLWAVFLQVGITIRQSSYEPRYVYVLIPILVLMWASFVAWSWQQLAQRSWSVRRNSILTALFSLVLIAFNFDKINALNLVLREKGLSWTVRAVVMGDWASIFPAYLPGFMEDYKAIADKIHRLVDQDESIDRLVMFDYFLYYFVDPGRLPARVRVDYPAVPYIVSHFDLNGQVLTQHPRGNMYSYFRFSEPKFKLGERRVLYADLMPMPSYPYRWQQGPAELYLFSYKELSAPDVDLEKTPTISPQEVLQRYKRVFGW